jgi:hypothetical protein
VTALSLSLSAPAVADSQSVSLSGTGAPVTTPSDSGTQGPEFLTPENENSPEQFSGVVTDRTMSQGHAAGNGVSVGNATKSKSNPTFVTGFQGLNIYQERYTNSGNQLTFEPPDQGMCAGGGHVVEAVNDVMNIYDTTGASQLPDNTATNIVSGHPRNVDHAVDLNSFYGYPPVINRATGVSGPELTDPSCIYDAATQRFFVLVLTLDRTPGGALTLDNHLDLAVSKTPDPTGAWNIYKIDVTHDGTNTGGVNPGPYLGDYPHIGADANGVYLTTNAYPWNENGFAGAQIYALSKAQLAAGASSVTMQHIDTSGMVAAPSDAGTTQPGFTVWPAQSPGTSSFNTSNKGTEYFLSSNAADEATHPVAGFGGNYTSTQLVTWSMTNTASLNTAHPAVSLTNQLVTVGEYALPPKQHQPGSGTAPGTGAPLGHCINDTTTMTIAGTGCWKLLFTSQPGHNEKISTPDSNDTRMQQVTYANGKLWGALDTAVTVGGGNRAGIAWYVVKPGTNSFTPTVALAGYLGAAGQDFVYPAIGVTASGRGVMAFTATGDSMFPSAGYASIDALAGVGPWNVVPGGDGKAVDDGFTSYIAEVGNPPRTRWGDYGSASVDGNTVWIASEYIAAACDYTSWGGPFFGGTGDNLLGTCGGADHGPGVRTALANWSTRISSFVP